MPHLQTESARLQTTFSIEGSMCRCIYLHNGYIHIFIHSFQGSIPRPPKAFQVAAKSPLEHQIQGAEHQGGVHEFEDTSFSGTEALLCHDLFLILSRVLRSAAGNTYFV